ncbi:hypothetical protein ACHAW5_007444, partial [Stephanodiscus triporus]
MMNSRSIGSGSGSGSGSISDGDGTLILPPPRMAGTTAPQPHHASSSAADWEYSDQDDSSRRKGQSQNDIIYYEPPIFLTQSTHSFLFTEPTCSLPFAFASLVMAMSFACLVLALLYNLYDAGDGNNPLNVPVNVNVTVKITQYLALTIGLLMEEEIPESLYLLRVISKRSLRGAEPDIRYSKFVTCALLRVISGYLFIVNFFVVVVQETSVIGIFFDGLALQFLQQIDDVAFRLARFSVFGTRIKRASMRRCFQREFQKSPPERRKKVTRFVGALYLVNFCIMMTGMAVITARQSRGQYTCQSITTRFGDNIWENAFVVNSTTGRFSGEKFDLIYSYFNGVYVANGTRDGRPVYTEQNKGDSSPYQVKVGATIRYCKEERAWVFMHEHIHKDAMTLGSSCPWLLRSPETDSFNLMEVLGDWSIWTGTISTNAAFRTTCNFCKTYVDCNYHGVCIDGRCVCEISESDGRPLYTGEHCEHPRACERLVGNGGGRWEILSKDDNTHWTVYGRGVYRLLDEEANSTISDDHV